MLAERPINPMLPWEMSLPLFSSDPRCEKLPPKLRRDLFDEHCKQLIISRRSKAKKVADRDPPEADFQSLLQSKVTSTRTTFQAFSKSYGEDARFISIANDKKREALFDDWLVQLGESRW